MGQQQNLPTAMTTGHYLGTPQGTVQTPTATPNINSMLTAWGAARGHMPSQTPGSQLVAAAPGSMMTTGLWRGPPPGQGQTMAQQGVAQQMFALRPQAMTKGSYG